MFGRNAHHEKIALRRDARLYLKTAAIVDIPTVSSPTAADFTLSPQVVPRLTELLSAYPGSRHGNAETRGLDSRFAEETYVDTGLDKTLQREVRDGEVDLIILFGNAGDGKTSRRRRPLKAPSKPWNSQLKHYPFGSGSPCGA